jgi:transcriptional regulator with XRE-family HTH domain
MNYGKIIRRLRASNRQTDFAERLGITQTYLSLLESGQKKPSLSLLEGLGRVFDLDVWEVLSLGFDGSKESVRRFAANATIKKITK